MPRPRTCRNRLTGTRITVDTPEGLGFANDDPEERWFTLCEEHHQLCSHPNRRYAEAHAAQPYWCSECQAIILAKE